MNVQQDGQRIDNQKVVLKAAQTIWATNKYFALACGQQYYRKIREYLKPNHVELDAAFQLLKQIDEEFKLVPTEELPQISNALYHMAGYFKTLLPHHDRQKLNQLIKENAYEALHQLQNDTVYYKVNYLAKSNIWPSQRSNLFNQVNISITDNGITYAPNELLWEGTHLIVCPTYSNV